MNIAKTRHFTNLLMKDDNIMCTMEDCNAVSDIREIKQSLTRIQEALVGNEYSPMGAIERIYALENQVQTISQSINMVKWVAIGFGLAGTGVGAAMVKMLIML